MNKYFMGLSVLFLCACTSDGGGTGSVFKSINVIDEVSVSEIRYVGGTIDVDVDVYGSVPANSLEVWLTDPASSVTSLGMAVKNGDTYSFNYTVPANTNLDGSTESYSLRLLVRDGDGNTLRDANVDVSVPAMQLPPDPPSFP